MDKAWERKRGSGGVRRRDNFAKSHITPQLASGSCGLGSNIYDVPKEQQKEKESGTQCVRERGRNR